jgi:GT2 family glycosyltransferase
MAAADWERMRGYDERMLGYGVEDGDLVLRALKAGIAISRGSTIVYHIAHDEGSPQIKRARGDWWNRASINPDRHDHNHLIRAQSIWTGGPEGEWGCIEGPMVDAPGAAENIEH